jgi:glycosyltransferase involved in cell wall biosynthesis
VEAAGILVREGLHFELELVGDGPMRGAIEALVEQLGVGRQVRLAGWMVGAEVRQAILAARALVLPSFAEGLPVAVMEALALGRPVITSAVAGTPELVESGRTGWLVPAGSVDGLAAAMRAALEAAPSRLSEMGRAGAALVAKLHDAGREAARLAALFEAAGASADVRAHLLAPAAEVVPMTGGEPALPAATR